ncbi:MAG: VWA domain-containing protein [Planctomycetota bacterium]|nr:MAG: VWA domain-containing protein [Planctomycetota bacterium]
MLVRTEVDAVVSEALPALQAALIAAAAALVLAAAAEWLHSRRVRRVAQLAFGPRGRPAGWAVAAPFMRVAAASAVAWGLVALLLLPARTHSLDASQQLSEHDVRHILIVLDVSPSMRLVDAGPSREQSRMARARDVVDSFFRRVPLSNYRVSVVATYNGAKPVVVDTRDYEVIRNILGDLPMHYAFPAGQTKIFDGLEEAAKLARPWNPGSTTLVLVTDGDTVPATGMPALPASISGTLVVGVGDANVGKFIDGKQSRQDRSTLRQIAARLRGTYHDANEAQIPTNLVVDSFGLDGEGPLAKLTLREYALAAVAVGAALLALLPVLLRTLGAGWRPGVRAGVRAARTAQAPRAGRGGIEPLVAPAPSRKSRIAEVHAGAARGSEE